MYNQLYFYGREDLVEFQEIQNLKRVTFDGQVKSIQGGNKSFFIIDNQLQTWAFGANWKGQLGLGYKCDWQLIPCQTSKSFDYIHSSDSYSYGISEDGLYSWGEATHGSTMCPKSTEAPIQVYKSAEIVCCSNQRAYFIANKTLFGVGNTSLMGVQHHKVSSIRPLKIFQNVYKISTTIHHTLCLTFDGYVYSWGMGSQGELGHEMDSSEIELLVLRPKLISGLSKIEDVQTSNHYSLALNNLGEVFEWGKGYKNLDFNEALKIKKIEFPDKMSRIQQISSCLNNSAAIDQLGRLYIWDQNNPEPFQLKAKKLKCKQILCGDRIVFFVASHDGRYNSEYYKIAVRCRLQSMRDYVKHKNRRISNEFYNEDGDARLLSDLNLENVQKTDEFVPIDYLKSSMQRSPRKLLRKSSIQILREDAYNAYRNQRRSIQQEMKASQQTVKSSKNLNLNLNPMIKKALVIDKVNELILDSERSNPLYIPFERPRIYTQRIEVQPLCKRMIIEDQDVLKYEYMNQIQKGYEEKIFRDNIRNDSDKLPINYQKIKNDILRFEVIFLFNQENKYVRMQKQLKKLQLQK